MLLLAEMKKGAGVVDLTLRPFTTVVVGTPVSQASPRTDPCVKDYKKSSSGLPNPRFQNGQGKSPANAPLRDIRRNATLHSPSDAIAGLSVASQAACGGSSANRLPVA
jgi:hypothetical protein